MPAPNSDADFANAFAPLLEVQQRGRVRPATANDILELLDGDAGRYVLKGKGGYLAVRGAGWTTRQRDALVIPDRTLAHSARREGRRENGVATKVVRLRRRGTCGIESVRMRAGVDVSSKDGGLGLGVDMADAMEMLTALTGAKSEE